MALRRKAQRFFEEIWSRDDAWALDTSPFEQARYDALIAALADRQYANVLEIGCGAGAFTARLARLADRVLGLDISPTAIAKAKERLAGAGRAEFCAVDIMDIDLTAEGPFDLIVFTETIYYLGWIYSFFDLGWLASKIFDSSAPDGRLLLANTTGLPGDYLLLPWLVRTYHDLFRNVGYTIESETTYAGEKDGTAIDVLITVFNRRGAEASTSQAWADRDRL